MKKKQKCRACEGTGTTLAPCASCSGTGFAYVDYDGGEIDPEHLSLAEIERATIASHLRRHKGNFSAAAETLGIPVRTLYHKVQTLGLEQEEWSCF